jgi:hypothetical protein
MDINQLNKIVIALVGIKNADIWWHSPNKAFDNKTPFDVIIDDKNRIEKYLLSHLNGDY